jgi:hypothetical protein
MIDCGLDKCYGAMDDDIIVSVSCRVASVRWCKPLMKVGDDEIGRSTSVIGRGLCESDYTESD